MGPVGWLQRGVASNRALLVNVARFLPLPNCAPLRPNVREEAKVRTIFLKIVIAGWAWICLSPAASAIPTPEDELAGIFKLLLAKNASTEWTAVERIPGSKWAPLPPASLNNCLPDGGCYARQGTLALGGRSLVLIATGARTIVSHIYLRNTGAAFGENAVLASLEKAGLSADLARCPVPGTVGDTNWYRLKAAATQPGFLSVQRSCGGKPCEGFSVSYGTDLPALQPNQLRMYSEECGAGTAARKPVSTAMPHELLAQDLANLLPPATGLYDWATVQKLLPDAKWGPPYRGAGGEQTRSAQLKVAGREFSVLASGPQTQVKAITFDEGGLHRKGEDLLSVLRAKGLQVKLTRCGPVYTESVNNWYSVTSAKTKPVMLRQSLRLDGNQIQDAYELRLDATLPNRDPRDREPGVNGCR
jgi:hypothetical protein